MEKPKVNLLPLIFVLFAVMVVTSAVAIDVVFFKHLLWGCR